MARALGLRSAWKRPYLLLKENCRKKSRRKPADFRRIPPSEATGIPNSPWQKTSPLVILTDPQISVFHTFRRGKPHRESQRLSSSLCVGSRWRTRRGAQETCACLCMCVCIARHMRLAHTCSEMSISDMWKFAFSYCPRYEKNIRKWGWRFCPP